MQVTTRRALADLRRGGGTVAGPDRGLGEEPGDEIPAVSAVNHDVGAERRRLAHAGNRSGASGKHGNLREAGQGEVHSTVDLAVEARRSEVVFHPGVGSQGKAEAFATAGTEFGRGRHRAVRGSDDRSFR